MKDNGRHSRMLSTLRVLATEKTTLVERGSGMSLLYPQRLDRYRP